MATMRPASSSSSMLRRTFASSSKVQEEFGLVRRVRGLITDIPATRKDTDGFINPRRSPDDPEVPDHLRYRAPPLGSPDTSHPRYKHGEVMDFRDKHSQYPPHLARQRTHKLSHAKKLGVNYDRLNRVPGRPVARPNVSVRITDGKVSKTNIQYTTGTGMATKEKQAYFEDVSEEVDEVEPINWNDVELADNVEGLEPGRIVETRRSGKQSLGMVLATIITGTRMRLLVLRAYGDIWPIDSDDVQFLLPSSLVNKDLADSCWSPEVLALWAKGEQESAVSDQLGEMLDSRRKVALILRKIIKETERMRSKMTTDSVANGGIEGLWERFASEDDNTRSTTTAVEAASYLLSGNGNGNAEIKQSTLPAFAAYDLMMQRSDLFLADPTSMVDSSRFLVRSRAERERLVEVNRLCLSSAEEDKSVISEFVRKVKVAKEESEKISGDSKWQSHPSSVQWTNAERDIIWALLMGLYETRSTQYQLYPSVIANVLKMTGLYGESEQLDRALVPLFARDIGILPPWETLKRPETLEDEARSKAMRPFTRRSEGELYKGNELDDLRQDFTSHRVYVIDDAGSMELDDGLSLERVAGTEDHWIHVHVADPTRLISQDHPLATNAAYRGTSLYLPEGNLPMLQHDMIMKQIHLGAQIDGPQPVMTFSSRVTSSGEVTDSKVQLGWIKKPNLITYDSVDDALGVANAARLRPLGTPIGDRKDTSTAPVDPGFVEDLRIIQDLALKHRRSRLQNAGLDWSQPSPNIALLNPPPNHFANLFDASQIPMTSTHWTGTPLIDYSVGEESNVKSSRNIVAEMMMMAGRAGARFCTERRLPVSYRVTQQPTVGQLAGQRMMTIEDLLSKRDPDTLRINYLELAKLSLHFAKSSINITPGPHWAMGFTDDIGYIRTTSPLRRYDDLLAHWQIKSALAKEAGLDKSLASGMSEGDVERMVTVASIGARNSRSSEKFSEAWWQTQIIRSRLFDNPKPEGYTYDDNFVDLTQPVEAVVSGATIYNSEGNKLNTPATIPSVGINLRLEDSSAETIGEKVMVKISKALSWPKPLIAAKPA